MNVPPQYMFQAGAFPALDITYLPKTSVENYIVLLHVDTHNGMIIPCNVNNIARKTSNTHEQNVRQNL